MLKSIGRIIAEMMVQDFERYKDVVNLEVGGMLDCDDPFATHEKH